MIIIENQEIIVQRNNDLGYNIHNPFTRKVNSLFSRILCATKPSLCTIMHHKCKHRQRYCSACVYMSPVTDIDSTGKHIIHAGTQSHSIPHIHSHRVIYLQKGQKIHYTYGTLPL